MSVDRQMTDDRPAQRALAQVARTLRERGMRVTPQRLLIYRTVTERPQHLTAEDVQERVARTLPGVSLPTVYATLDLFVQLGLIGRISTGVGPTIFDSRIDRRHAHMVCTRCGRIFDLDVSPAPPRALQRAREQGFATHAGQLILYGVCAQCQARTASQADGAPGSRPR